MLNRQTLIMILLMTLMMGLIMSAWFTWQLEGFGPTFMANWASRFVSTYIIVLPTVLIVSPIAQRLAKLVANPTARSSPLAEPRAVAMDAWRRNARGHNGEGFSDWYELLSNDVVISMPLGEFRGENHGLVKARGIYSAIENANPRLIYDEPLRVTEAGNTVVIEFNDHGTIAGYPYKNRIAASFDIKDGKVAAYREYFGDIDPVVVAMMTGSVAGANPKNEQAAS